MNIFLGLAALLALLALAGCALPSMVRNYAPSVPPATPGTVRIACVGDSITFGMLVKSRSQNSYPAQLERLLGAGFSVRNFGANGHAVQKDADHPYWIHRYFRPSAELQPDIVLLMLGTNDARQPNWRGTERFEQDYRLLVSHYKDLPGRPRLYLLTPPSQFDPMPRIGMVPTAVGQIAEVVRRVGESLALPVIDIHATTSGYPEGFSFDGVHINVRGARRIAEAVFTVLSRDGVPDEPAAPMDTHSHDGGDRATSNRS